MKLTLWKRSVLAGLLTLSVAGGTLAPVVAGHAAAGWHKCVYDEDHNLLHCYLN
jgi:hypothetical protein